MRHSSKAIGKQTPVPQRVASQSAPVVEPPRAPARPVQPSGNGHDRTARAPKAGGKRNQPSIPSPSLPPAQQAPARLTPVLFFLAQTSLDIIAIAGAFGLAYWLRFESDIFRIFVTPDSRTYLTMLGLTVATMLVTFYFSKLYALRRGASRFDEFYRIAAAVSMGTVLSLATNSLILADKFVYSRQILLMGWVFAIVFVTALRVLSGYIIGALHKQGVDRSRVIVVGTGQTAAMVIGRLEFHRALGYKVVGVIAERDAEPSAFIRPEMILGDISQLSELVSDKADEVILALGGVSDRELRDTIMLLQDMSVSIKIYPDAFQLATDYEVSVDELSGLPLLRVKDVALHGWNRILKRAFDVAFSAVILVIAAPVMMMLAAAVKLSGPGPVFFIQERVGLDNKPFALVKFRSMRTENDPAVIGAKDAKDVKEEGPQTWTVSNDPRRTRFGAFLRRFSLDELPQFYNVLIGEMSIVGPRPEQPHYVEEFAQLIPQLRYQLPYMRRHREKAGITGWAQVNGLRGDTSIEDRTKADLYYVENWSLLFDLKIIARTVYSMFRGKNAY